jgi:methylitaconate Delta-isomerase
MANMDRVRCCIMRGGTSKGIFLMKNDLPRDAKERDALICKVFGSPDVRQIDGLGGADPLTSKLAIIGPSSRPDADVDYTFGQVGINEGHVDYSGNCGNISAAGGPFAIDEGLVAAGETLTTVRVHNTNTSKIIVADVPIVNGKAAVAGDCVIDGVPGSGAKIMLDYSDTAGAVTGKMLPTGNVVDMLDIEGFGKIEASIVDVANPVVFIRAKDIGFIGTETPQEINSNKEKLDLLEKIRGTAAVKIGMAKDLADALKNVPAFPMTAFVTSPAQYTTFTGKTVKAEDIDIVSRLMFMQTTHKTYPGTGTICTGAAIKIPGTIANEMVSRAEEKSLLQIGHPAGIIDVEVSVENRGGQIVLKRAAMSRTARRIMDGYVYVK